MIRRSNREELLMHTDDDPPAPAVDGEAGHESLRGTFVIVVLMAAFFVVCWLGVFTIAMGRR
jgi:hypothetical protein